MTEYKPANRPTTGKPRGKPFAPGVSGNPRGRPKQTAEQKDALETIKGLTHKAARLLDDVLTDNSAPLSMRIRAAEIVLDRTYGKPIQPVDVEPPVDMSALERAFADPGGDMI